LGPGFKADAHYTTNAAIGETLIGGMVEVDDQGAELLKSVFYLIILLTIPNQEHGVGAEMIQYVLWLCIHDGIE